MITLCFLTDCSIIILRYVFYTSVCSLCEEHGKGENEQNTNKRRNGRRIKPFDVEQGFCLVELLCVQCIMINDQSLNVFDCQVIATRPDISHQVSLMTRQP